MTTKESGRTRMPTSSSRTTQHPGSVQHNAAGAPWPVPRKALPLRPVHQQTLRGSHRDGKLAQVRGSHPNWLPSQKPPRLNQNVRLGPERGSQRHSQAEPTILPVLTVGLPGAPEQARRWAIQRTPARGLPDWTCSKTGGCRLERHRRLPSTAKVSRTARDRVSARAHGHRDRPENG